VTPQSLAIHEAVADLAALLVSLRCRELGRRVLAERGGSIERSSVFSGLAEQFAGGLDRNRAYLRDLATTRRSPRCRPASRTSSPRCSRARFYRVFLRTYEELRAHYDARSEVDPDLVAAPEASYVQQKAEKRLAEGGAARGLESAEKALFVAAERLKRTLLRGLDYLPRGTVDFADLARAVLASDRASHPQSGRPRGGSRRSSCAGAWWPRRATSRCGRSSPATPSRASTSTSWCPRLRRLQLRREPAGLARIPAQASFELRPRLGRHQALLAPGRQAPGARGAVQGLLDGDGGQRLGGGLPRRRRYRAGTTLAIGLDAGRPYVKALLGSRRTAADRGATDGLLRALVAEERSTSAPRRGLAACRCAARSRPT